MGKKNILTISMLKWIGQDDENSFFFKTEIYQILLR
jgi:hypothetical protein